MGKKIYVGNLLFSVTEETLGSVFMVHGNVESAKIVVDRYTGQSKGFGFVEMSDEAEAFSAIEKLNGTEQFGRNIKVSEAKMLAPRESGRNSL